MSERKLPEEIRHDIQELFPTLLDTSNKISSFSGV